MMSRQVKFFVIEKLLLPLAVLPLRALIRTWRIRVPDSATAHRVMATERMVLVTYHGLFFHLLAYGRMARSYGRQFVVMTSPSHDGRLLAAFLQRFGIRSVRGSSRSRNVAGSREFVRRLEAGDVGLIAVDGPRGPRCMVKPGFLKIAALARAQLLLVATSASYGVTFGTWDRAHLPGPFARIDLAFDLVPSPSTANALQRVPAVAATLQTLARQIASPVILDPANENRANQA